MTKEIENLEKQKDEFSWEKSLPTREIIDQEATKGVKYSEVALNLGLEIESLEETHGRLTARINFSKTKLESSNPNFLFKLYFNFACL